MELIRDLHNLRPRHRGCVVTMGAFDGVHRGHQMVLKHLMDKGRELGLPSTVVIFEPLPREYFAPEDAPARLMSFHEKFLALRDLGIDRVLRIRFTPHFRDLSPEAFVNKVFVDGLGVKYIVVGDDLHFGRNRSGGLEQLRAAGELYGFEVQSTSTLEQSGERISSTRIREALKTGDFALAEALLGRPYSIMGRIVVGNQLGRQMNVPTANIQLRRLSTALGGVYAVSAAVAGQTYNGVANVGMRPTIGDLDRPILEVHLFEFTGDIYGETMTVVFIKKLRDENKFDSFDVLRQQIHADIDRARAFFQSQDI